MGWFSKKEQDDSSKKSLNSYEYEQVLKRISELYSRVSVFETSIEVLKTDISNLRGKFNQRLKGLAEAEKKEDEKVSFNNDGLVAFG